MTNIYAGVWGRVQFQASQQAGLVLGRAGPQKVDLTPYKNLIFDPSVAIRAIIIFDGVPNLQSCKVGINKILTPLFWQQQLYVHLIHLIQQSFKQNKHPLFDHLVTPYTIWSTKMLMPLTS